MLSDAAKSLNHQYSTIFAFVRTNPVQGKCKNQSAKIKVSDSPSARLFKTAREAAHQF
jgi:hypothetical protein